MVRSYGLNMPVLDGGVYFIFFSLFAENKKILNINAASGRILFFFLNCKQCSCVGRVAKHMALAAKHASNYTWAQRHLTNILFYSIEIFYGALFKFLFV